MIHAFIQKITAFNVRVEEELWFLWGHCDLEWKWEEKSSGEKKKTVQMPSPGLLNLRGSKGKRDVSDFQKAPVFRPDLQQLQLSSAGASLSAARRAYRGPS